MAFGVLLKLPCEPAVGAEDHAIASVSEAADCILYFLDFGKLLLDSMCRNWDAPEGRVRQEFRTRLKTSSKGE
jgi:hypothetical protein